MCIRDRSIREAIEARQRVFADELRVSKDNVLTGLLEAVAVAQAQQNPAAMIAGWRELGRMLGYYQPEEHKITMGADGARLQARLTSMSDAELLALVTGQTALT